jgi:predicted RNA-binding protein YlqC (UPF0109 family)
MSSQGQEPKQAVSESGVDVRALVDKIARALVDEPDQVSVETFDEDGEIVAELTVAERDLGKVIGKQGRTARSIRAILSAAGTKLDRRVSLEILE